MKIGSKEIKKIIDEEIIAVAREVRRVAREETSKVLRRSLKK